MTVTRVSLSALEGLCSRTDKDICSLKVAPCDIAVLDFGIKLKKKKCWAVTRGRNCSCCPLPIGTETIVWGKKWQEYNIDSSEASVQRKRDMSRDVCKGKDEKCFERELRIK